MANTIQTFDDCPQLLRDFLFYLLTIRGRSPRTVEGYHVDLRCFFRYLRASRELKEIPEDLSQVSIVDLATIWLVSLVFAILETVLFPENAPCTKGRSLLWLAAANLCFVGGALLFGWFQGVPVWGGALLILGLELGLGMMWFGDRFVLKMDTAQLNEQLLRYQQHSSK